MQQTLSRTIRLAAAIAAAFTASSPFAPFAMAASGMSVAQQNALTQKYCAVCHNDAHKNGGLSLEHFDPAHPDPGVAAMMLSKIQDGALGAAGVAVPDETTIKGWESALATEAVGADKWRVSRTPAAGSKAEILTASIVQQVPTASTRPDLYRLTLTCQAGAPEGEMLLAWAPGVPKTDAILSASVDATTPISYKIEGTEKMGNGTDGQSGPGSIVLATSTSTGAPKLLLPVQTLTIRNAFANEAVEFPFSALPKAARKTLSRCFQENKTAQ